MSESLTILAVTVGIVACVIIGSEAGIRATQKDAIKAGVARWVADPATGTAKFEYITPK